MPGTSAKSTPASKLPINKAVSHGEEPGNSLAFAFISIALLIHLFCVFSCLAANYSPSLLQARIVAAPVVSPYVQQLNLDLDFTPFHLTHATELDVDHRLEALPADAAPSDDDAWIVLPSDTWPGSESHKRIQRLAKLVSVFAAQEADDLAAEVARSAARHFVVGRELALQQLRFRRHLLQTWDASAGRGTLAERNPNDAAFFNTAYAANVLADDGGNVDVLKVSGRRETAQPTTSAPSTPDAPGNSSTGNATP